MQKNVCVRTKLESLVEVIGEKEFWVFKLLFRKYKKMTPQKVYSPRSGEEQAKMR